ncbi:MAG: carboxymuconolactone decarboxylase family protein [Salinarimonadaceae bacterium]|nr:MAG: carboxymuconolactone decarboxylase family protein [Salinarimonadaceae bacterium]
MSDDGARKRELKETFTRQRGYWSDLWSNLLDRDPDFFEAYMHFSSVPWLRDGLDPKVREFVYIAIDASTTHLYDPGTKIHMINAFRYGATAGEILEVLELISMQGIHSSTVGAGILLEELAAAGMETPADRPLSADQEALKARFVEARGYWDERWDAILRLSPDYFEASLNFVHSPWKSGSLAPKIRELVYVAIAAATTHLHEPAIRLHVRNALKHGASAQEIMEVFELISVLGVHTITSSLPIMEQVIAEKEPQKAAE